jgi:GWxTD domain-containing protein
MNMLQMWVNTPLSGALGWTLLHSLWQGAIVSAALGAVLFTTRSPRIRYAAACLAMLAILIASGVTFAHLSAGGATIAPVASVGSRSSANFRSDAPGDDTPSKFLTLVPWLAPLWVAGVWICYLGQVAGWIRASRLRDRGACHAPHAWQELAAQLSARLRVSRPVLLVESCLVDAPSVLGHLRPVILMPIGLLTNLPAAQIEAILLHELAHIRRCDYLLNIFQRVIEGWFFYHPAMWWVSRVIRVEREHCCDDIAVAIGGDAHEYASALAALEQNRGPAFGIATTGIAANGGNLMNRIHRLLYPSQKTAAPSFAALILLATATVALAAWAHPQNSQVQPASADRYAKWLDEEVVYIIAPEERSAFQKLSTDKERDEFIEQFWRRRDPAPGTGRNKFQEEHYRRIAYANERFPTMSGKTGWRTDRGRIYIVDGPPDEIDSHPNGRAEIAYPFESWRYRYLEGYGANATFTFFDRGRNGDYRLQPEKAQ